MAEKYFSFRQVKRTILRNRIMLKGRDISKLSITNRRKKFFALKKDFYQSNVTESIVYFKGHDKVRRKERFYIYEANVTPLCYVYAEVIRLISANDTYLRLSEEEQNSLLMFLDKDKVYTSENEKMLEFYFNADLLDEHKLNSFYGKTFFQKYTETKAIMNKLPEEEILSLLTKVQTPYLNFLEDVVKNNGFFEVIKDDDGFSTTKKKIKFFVDAETDDEYELTEQGIEQAVIKAKEYQSSNTEYRKISIQDKWREIVEKECDET